MKPPNILMIMTDQQRWDSLSCYGCHAVQTPNIDRLAREGMLFENCYVNNPICTPSRASILTGRPLTGHGVYRLHSVMPPNATMFPVLLQKKNYRTALFGKLHISGRAWEREKRLPSDGFDIYEYAMTPHDVSGDYNAYGKWLREKHPEFYEKLKNKGRKVGHIPPEVHFTTWAVDRSIHFIESGKEDRPFFCLTSVVDPHDPYNDYPLEVGQDVKKEAIGYPKGKNKSIDGIPQPVIDEMRHGYLGDITGYSDEQIAAMRFGYYASITFLDQQVGRLLSALDKNGIAEDTIVVFVSDHGDMLGDHNLLGKGAFFYDPSVRVPLLIRYPRQISAGQRVRRIIQPHHIAATLLRQAGYSPEELSMMPDSENLIGTDDPLDYSDMAVCTYRATGICDAKTYWRPSVHATMLRAGDYKLNVFHTAFDKNGMVQGELYNMSDDPDELNNLWESKAYACVRREMTEKLLNWLVSSDWNYHCEPAGDVFPPRSQWLINNPL